MGNETQPAGTAAAADQGQLPLGGAVATPPMSVVTTPATAPAAPKIEAAPVSTETKDAAAPEQKQDAAKAAAKAAEAKAEDKGKAAGEKPPADPFADWKPKLPEGVEADPDLLGALKVAAKDPAGAQALVDAYAAVEKRREEAWTAQRAKTIAGWREAFKSDKEIGGADTEANAKAADRALVRFGSPELKQLLEDAGLNAHPEIARLLVRVEKATGEDRIAGKTNGVAAGPGDGIDLRALYPNTPSLHPKT